MQLLTVLQFTVTTESDELSPLIQRLVSASAAELRAEAAAQKAEADARMQLFESGLMSEISALQKGIQEMNQRSLRMEAQLLGLIPSSAGAPIADGRP